MPRIVGNVITGNGYILMHFNPSLASTAMTLFVDG